MITYKETASKLRDIAARWAEYGPTNTIVGNLCDGKGGYCAHGDILRVEGGAVAEIRTMMLSTGEKTNFYAMRFSKNHVVGGAGILDVTCLLGITPGEAAQIFRLNDRNNERPVAYMLELADKYESLAIQEEIDQLDISSLDSKMAEYA